ncbi:class I lanthipeptide [Croceivirga thetidis]|uniref:Bacteriocin n=1 Tax=Croceivirga thetidis TaxID=2721623 RepID=A0ABX1GPB1_9FLAO|nr:class I lanthipeptide [Croceivirga thetidis]NKI30795.1 hypothetical protein [Croceivirga thetidis]
MKKSKKIGLSLNKKVISNFQKEQLNGGSSWHTNIGCPTMETCIGNAECGNHSDHCYDTRACDY